MSKIFFPLVFLLTFSISTWGQDTKDISDPATVYWKNLGYEYIIDYTLNSKGYAVIRKDNKSGLSKNEQIIIECKYDAVFVNFIKTKPIITVLYDNRKRYAIADSNGNIGKYSYKKVELANSPYIIVTSEGADKKITKSILDYVGKTIFSYDDMAFSPYCPDKHFLVCKNRKWGMVDTSNKIIIPLQYETITGAGNEKHFIVSVNGKYGTIDYNNSVVIDLAFDKVSPSYNEKGSFYQFSFVSLNNNCGVVNSEGKLVIPMIYDKIYFADHYQMPYLKVEKENLVGIINSYNEIIIPLQYQDILQIENNRFRVYQNGYYGVVSEQNKIIIPIEYMKIWRKTIIREKQNYFDVSKDGKNHFLIDEKNKIIEQIK